MNIGNVRLAFARGQSGHCIRHAPLAMYDPSAYIREMSRQDSECASHHQRQVRYEARLEKTAAFRQRRAADTARWRERLHRGAAVYPVEVDGQLFDLMERFGELKDSKTYDRQAVATALGKLLRRALEALLREEAASATCSRTGSERPARPTLTEGQLR